LFNTDLATTVVHKGTMNTAAYSCSRLLIEYWYLYLKANLFKNFPETTCYSMTETNHLMLAISNCTRTVHFHSGYAMSPFPTLHVFQTTGFQCSGY